MTDMNDPTPERVGDWTLERDEDGEPARLRWTPETAVEVLIDILPVLVERLHMEVHAFHKGWSTDMRRKGRCGAPNKCQHAWIERLIARAEKVIKMAAVEAAMKGETNGS